MKTIKEGFLRKNLGLGKETLIKNWLEKYRIKNYTINDDWTIDIGGYIDLEHYTEKQLPDYIRFGTLVGFFVISKSPNLESLEGCPKEVCGDFYCYNCNNLESLKGCPNKVSGNFSCRRCSKLESLKGAPKEVGGYFDCRECGRRFTKQDVKKVSEVKRRIYI